MKKSTVVNDWLNRIESDSSTRKVLVDIGKGSLNMLVEALPHANKAQTWHILNMLSQIGEPRVATAVERLLYSPHKVIRIAAIQCLEKLASTHSTGALIDLLLDEESEDLHIWTIHALGELKAIESIPHLFNILEATDSTVTQYTIIKALQVIGDPIAIQTIMRYTDSDNHHVRDYSRNALDHFASLGYCS